MTDPIQVLTEAINAAYGGDLDAGRVDAEKMLGRYEAALQQVAALVQAARQTADDYPYEGRFVRAALATFKENP